MSGESTPIQEKVLSYIRQNSQKCSGKTIDEVLSIMEKEGCITAAEIKEANATSVFGTDKSDDVMDAFITRTHPKAKAELTLPSGRKVVLIDGKKHYYAKDGKEINEKHFIKYEGNVDLRKSGRFSVTDKKGVTAYFDNKGQQIKKSQFNKAEGVKLSLADEFKARHSMTSKSLKTAEDSNGFFGGLWSGFKNLTGIGSSSNKVRKNQTEEEKLIAQLSGSNPAAAFKELTGQEYNQENIDKFIDGEIKLKSEAALEGYVEGQEMAADIGGDIVAGITAMGT